MKTLQNILFAALIAIAAFSCQTDSLPEDSIRYVPANVGTVSVMNLQNLMDKADFEAVKKMAFYEDAVGKISRKNAAFAKIMADPARAGIALDENVYLVSEHFPGKNSKGFVAVLLSVADRAALEKTLESLDVEFVPAGQSHGYLSDRHTTLVWNDEVAILGIGENAADTKAKVEAYLRLPADQRVAENKHFRQFLNEDFDLAAWMSTDGIVEDLDFKEAAGLLRLTKEDLKGNYLRHYLKFEDGRIVAETQYDLKKKLTNDLYLLFQKKVDTDFIAGIPTDQLVFFSTLGLQPKGINQWIVEKHIKGTAIQELEQYGISMDDLVNALDGDVMLAAYTGQEASKAPVPLFAARIADQDRFDKMLTIALENQFLEKSSDGLYLTKEQTREVKTDTGAVSVTFNPNAKLLVSGDIVYLSRDAAILHKIEAGDFARTNFNQDEIRAISSANIFGAFLDMSAVGPFKDDFHGLGMQNIIAQADREQASATMRFEDEQTNSLRQLFRWMNEQYLRENSRRQEEKETKI